MTKLQQFVHTLQQQLQQPLPGIAAQSKMASSLRHAQQWQIQHPNPARQAATMLLLYEKNDHIHTALMQRTKDGYAHSGQISFPGGRHDPQDKDLYATALRETEEEFGIDRQTIQLLGKLTDLYVPASNNLIFPVIGSLATAPVFVPNPAEVAQIIEVPLPYLQRQDIVKQKTIAPYAGIEIDAPYFDIDGHVVWGATAMLLSEFLTLIATFYSPQ